MRKLLMLAIGAALLGFVTAPAPVLAQQKTTKACQEEWRANKAAYQAAKITERAYVEKCRAGESVALPGASAPSASTAPAAPSAGTAPAAPPAGNAQQKTARACQEEWRANREAYQAAKITERAYVEKCRAGESVALPAAPAPSASTAPAAPPPANAQQKTARACQEEWRANKAAYQAAKITERAYVEKCRAGESVALPAAPAPSTATAPSAPPPAATPAPARPTRSTARQAPAAPTGAGQFASESEAKARCPSDTVVWVNLNSKIYHFAGHRSYGTTKNGAYMCEGDATEGGFRASKTEKHPGA